MPRTGRALSVEVALYRLDAPPICTATAQDVPPISHRVSAGGCLAADSSFVQLPYDAPVSVLQTEVVAASNLFDCDVDSGAGYPVPLFDGNELPAQPSTQCISAPFDGVRSPLSSIVCGVCANPSCVCLCTHNHIIPGYDFAPASADDGPPGSSCPDTAERPGQ